MCGGSDVELSSPHKERYDHQPFPSCRSVLRRTI